MKKNTTKTDTQWGIRRARKQRLRIVEPQPNELQIDIDGAAELAFYRQQISVLRKNLPSAARWKERIKASKTPGRFHVTITCSAYAFDKIARVAFQAVLGSDLRRECFNLCRVLSGTKYPIVFFEEDK